MVVKHDSVMVGKRVQFIVRQKEQPLRDGERVVRFLLEHIFFLCAVILDELVVELHVMPDQDAAVANL